MAVERIGMHDNCQLLTRRAVGLRIEEICGVDACSGLSPEVLLMAICLGRLRPLRDCGELDLARYRLLHHIRYFVRAKPSPSAVGIMKARCLVVDKHKRATYLERSSLLDPAWRGRRTFALGCQGQIASRLESLTKKSRTRCTSCMRWTRSPVDRQKSDKTG